ncbi:AlkA N-terminal domain-containing protein [Reinekea marinisedimentorum]|uniref:DNA-3-methyladenine glycosylase II n=1 Tax=Reinekea marinisedimentorum TaxID=230495 RepID=A0A4R3ICY2_9GAMM|nr:AlkA N-terminal domain-containing protein [Reinekea marinisedimentorum]TCS43674.1 AraC family transcriptional regulator of adaptative response / DNA-3-methyladenine glycosylase II [Reinekea marinisedimentorum]
MELSLTAEQCQAARLARDPRFDGRFFTAVKTTGIFCRPVCPAVAPKETNVEYFANATQALQAGYRPCLRCRPESAPGSRAWLGTTTSFRRAVQLIDEGALQEQSLPDLAERLGMTDRHLRNLFRQQMGLSPKAYATLSQLLFAKQLLHNSNLSISNIAFAAGFNSVRRFNDAFHKHLKLTPSAVRDQPSVSASANKLVLTLKEPFNWQQMLTFYRLRAIDKVESVSDQSYGRNFRLNGSDGWFNATQAAANKLEIEFTLSDIRQLKSVVANIRRMFDLDADTQQIEEQLNTSALAGRLTTGLRIPGVWSPWEAGVRAILGQQVSVKAAITHLNRLVESLNSHQREDWQFPSAEQIAQADLSVLRMPDNRRQTLHRFACYVAEHGDHQPEDWLQLKGVGPWTVNYARLRGLSEPDCFLSTDLIVKKALSALGAEPHTRFSPWGSYATFHCWNLAL